MVKVGDKAPNFCARAIKGEKEFNLCLENFKGKKIALYFYPKDLTPGCTTQATNISENYNKLEKENIEVIGVSKDSIKSHKNFISKKKIPFLLVADEDKKINELYGVWQKKKFMGREFMGTIRTTFLINEEFKIIKIIDKPKVGEHANEIIEGFKTP